MKRIIGLAMLMLVALATAAIAGQNYVDARHDAPVWGPAIAREFVTTGTHCVANSMTAELPWAECAADSDQLAELTGPPAKLANWFKACESSATQPAFIFGAGDLVGPPVTLAPWHDACEAVINTSDDTLAALGFPAAETDAPIAADSCRLTTDS